MSVERKFLHFFTFSCISCQDECLDKVKTTNDSVTDHIYLSNVSNSHSTCDTTVTLAGGVVVGVGVILFAGVDGTPAGLAAGVPPAVITVWAF